MRDGKHGINEGVSEVIISRQNLVIKHTSLSSSGGVSNISFHESLSVSYSGFKRNSCKTLNLINGINISLNQLTGR